MKELTARRLAVAVLLSAALGACSSSGPSLASTASSVATSTTASADPAQVYVGAVNAACDALLPKIVTVTHGGSIDVPASEYLASWPAHKLLLDGFDAQVAAIPVPPTAVSMAAALAAYVHFADQLDAARLNAAHKGQAAYAKEVQSESGVESDPTITALAASGFNDSCTAR